MPQLVVLSVALLLCALVALFAPSMGALGGFFILVIVGIVYATRR